MFAKRTEILKTLRVKFIKLFAFNFIYIKLSLITDYYYFTIYITMYV